VSKVAPNSLCACSARRESTDMHAYITQLLDDHGKLHALSFGTEGGPELLRAALTVTLNDNLGTERIERSVKYS
jgi:hypothetical protein